MTTLAQDTVLTPEALLRHWQGHRGLTRRVIEAFPETELFGFSVGGMRPFAALVQEFLRMSVPTLQGVATGNWQMVQSVDAATKGDLLRLWDRDTAEIERIWPTIPAGRFQEVDTAFGQWEGKVYSLLFYIIDNEIHHRGQGYVYLRALGIDPPPFYER